MQLSCLPNLLILKEEKVSYFFDDKGIIREALLDEKAHNQAKAFVAYYENKRRNRKEIDKQRSLSSAQLRRFYGEFKQLQKMIIGKSFEQVKPLIKMVKSKASYAANPNNQKIPNQFKNFLIENIDRINSREDFDAFMLHFEAVVGFYYGMGLSNN